MNKKINNELFEIIDFYIIKTKISNNKKIYNTCIKRIDGENCIVAAVFGRDDREVACRAAASLIYTRAELESGTRIKNKNLVFIINYYGFKQLFEINKIKNVNYIITDSSECFREIVDRCKDFIVKIFDNIEYICDKNLLFEQASLRLERLK